MEFFETLIAVLCSNNGKRSAKRTSWGSKYIMRKVYDSKSKANISITNTITGEKYVLSKEDLSARDWEVIEEQ